MRRMANRSSWWPIWKAATGEFDPLRLPIQGLEGFGWEVALRTAQVGSDFIGGPLSLHDSMGLVYTRRPR